MSTYPYSICCALAWSLLVVCRSAVAWQEEYIANVMPGDMPTRYTWDSGHAPRYDDILAARIRAGESALNGALDAVPDERSVAPGWRMRVFSGLTTGPVAGWRWGSGTLPLFNDLPAETTVSGPVSTVGWRVNSAPGWLRPWMQISYNQPFTSDTMAPVPGAAESNWTDVSIGADMPLTGSVAAWAAMTQGGDVANTGDATLYTLGVSATF